MKCADLLQQDPSAAEGALQHSFLKACSDGSITPSQFNAWLQQDYNFVNAFAHFAERVRASSPSGHTRAYTDGLAALSEELTWFKARSSCLPSITACLLGLTMQTTCHHLGTAIMRLMRMGITSSKLTCNMSYV